MAWLLQDFTTFTEVDPNSKITVDADEITVVDSAYVDESYVRKDFGAGYFTGDFKFKVHIRPTSGLSGSWCLANSAISVQGMNYPTNDGILVWTTKGISYHLLSIQDNESGGYADNCSITDGTDYYLLIERTSGTITCKVYTDEAMTSLFDTLNTGSTNNTAYRYLFGYVNYGLAAAGTATTYVKDLYFYAEDLVAATPTADPVSGAVDFYTLVSLSCATPGATIRFTINGSEPTEVSPIYTSPIPILYPMTIKAKGFKDGMDDSEIGSFTYTLLYTPMSIGGGFYASKKKNNYLVQSDLLLRLVDITERLKAVDEHKNLIGNLEIVTFNDLSFERLGYTPLFYLDIEEDNYVG